MVGLDATLGFGGNAQELLKLIVPGGRLIGIDVDPLELPRTEARLRGLGFSEDVLFVKRMNFAGLPQLLTVAGGLFDFILADLGVSSMQLDNPERGFSFKIDAPLDLRLNPGRGQPASVFLKSITEEELTELLISNADEPHAVAIARATFENRTQINTTTQLVNIVGQALRRIPEQTRREETKKSLQRTFQALRIAVNDELNVLDQFLNLLPGCLKEGGRVAILTFHSGEDRRVKRSFLERYRSGIYSQIARDPIRSSGEERRANPRATCAKLRWAVKK
jgi:16S rRNA (cytosine1402-N4)-methyltransferase